MKKYYKNIRGTYIVAIGVNCGNIGISKSEYDDLRRRFEDRPQAPTGYRYFLQAETLVWELTEVEEQIEPSDDTDDEATIEDYESALTDLGVNINGD